MTMNGSCRGMRPRRGTTTPRRAALKNCLDVIPSNCIFWALSSQKPLSFFFLSLRPTLVWTPLAPPPGRGRGLTQRGVAKRRTGPASLQSGAAQCGRAGGGQRSEGGRPRDRRGASPPPLCLYHLCCPRGGRLAPFQEANYLPCSLMSRRSVNACFHRARVSFYP